VDQQESGLFSTKIILKGLPSPYVQSNAKPSARRHTKAKFPKSHKVVVYFRSDG
jgi:hypothetical protein